MNAIPVENTSAIPVENTSAIPVENTSAIPVETIDMSSPINIIPIELIYVIVKEDLISPCIFVNKLLYNVCKKVLSSNIDDVVKCNAHRLEVQLHNGKYCDFTNILLNKDNKEMIIAACVNILYNPGKFTALVNETAMEKIRKFHCVYDVVGRFASNRNGTITLNTKLSSLLQQYLYERYTRLFSSRYNCTYTFATWLYFLLVTPVVYMSYNVYEYVFEDRLEEPVLYNPYVNNKVIIYATISHVIRSKLAGKFGFIILRMMANYDKIHVRKLYKLCKRSRMVSNVNYMLDNYNMKPKYKKKLTLLLVHLTKDKTKGKKDV